MFIHGLLKESRGFCGGSGMCRILNFSGKETKYGFLGHLCYEHTALVLHYMDQPPQDLEAILGMIMSELLYVPLPYVNLICSGVV